MTAVAKKKDGKFNPSLKGVFSNKAFKGRDDSDGILIKMTPENYQTLMDNLRVGSALVIKYNAKTPFGSSYFADILPPTTENNQKVAKASSDLD